MAGFPIIALRACQCRFPVGQEGTTHLFCGKPASDPTKPWCVEHREVVFEKRERPAKGEGDQPQRLKPERRTFLI